MSRSLIPTLLDEIHEIQNFKNLFNDFDVDNFYSSRKGEPSGISLYEDDDNIYVEAGMPGIDTKDINVNLEKGMLWIEGKRKEEKEDKRLKYHIKAAACFSYRVPIPNRIDGVKEPKAVYKNGVLKIKFEKSREEKPKKIKIDIE